ncbi:UDP-3-O-(3-hydroxymyristoyl)glucosamine N-acyltransferase [Orrella daihaiensis]|uniref:UDP-3-O-acylglucosamine N-acyltransferase n=1 Tax=Orrella daihaiensis TaxID=2782176 RepID=A0ABY4AGF1_9BURK|nr:UDP-3-O-(3-hydroxymyristoyl)glucosamine N-acyltransferase [Orrella daihaiensis]UOD49365.1 UDP-3-O-(3-hydroxymyristoyl)glucosamine N-acyltransferase [Orrella daihaiensis]
MPVILPPTKAPTLTELLDDIAESRALVSSVLAGTKHSPDARIRGIGPLRSASADELSFVVSNKFKDELAITDACAVILPPGMQAIAPAYAQIVCDQPYLLYALIARWFDVKRQPTIQPGCHASAVIDETANVDPTAVIGPHVVIGAHTTVGAHVHILAGCVVGSNCEIGANSILYPNVTLYDNTRMGARCILHAGVVLGADGFGFAPNPMLAKGAWGKIAQLGGVRIGDDVEIGANTTIDRGALEDTVIGNGVKLDNQIMVGHNCQIGDHTAMAACVGVAGSTKIGKRCIIGGAAMFSGHISITDDVQISGGTAITSSIETPGRYTGVMPSGPHAQWQRNAAVLGKLSDLRKRVRQLERNPDEIE